MPGPNEIRLKINPKHTGIEDLEYHVERIAHIVIGTREYCEQMGGYRWMLGTANDWWMDFDEATKELILAYRYGHGRRAEMQALRTAIVWLLGLEKFA